MDRSNQKRLVEARLDIQTSADLFNNSQAAYQRAALEKSRQSYQQRSLRRAEAQIAGEADVNSQVSTDGHGPQSRKRSADVKDEQPAKRVRNRSDRVANRERVWREIADVLEYLDQESANRERASNEQEWCTAIPLDRKVSTARSFYEAFHDVKTMSVETCAICYRKYSSRELENIKWDEWRAGPGPSLGDAVFECQKCFPEGRDIATCFECKRNLRRGTLSAPTRLHGRLGCEHLFPDELKGLTPVEEKLIALNSCYGFLTRYSVSDGHRQGVAYPRHVKGHIIVFPNNV
jgi:hypothetical protein